MDIKFDQSKISIVPINAVCPNEWNPKEKNSKELQEVINSIKEKGLRQPIIVRETEQEGYEIVDGEQRWTACKELGAEEILIYNEGKISDQEAQELTIFYETHVPFNEADLSLMIARMIKDYPDPKFPFDPGKLQDLQRMADFNWDDYMANSIEFVESGAMEKEATIYTDEQGFKEIKKFAEDESLYEEKENKKKKVKVKETTRINVLKEQKQIIDNAITKCMKDNDLAQKGKALELICTDYLGGI